MGNRFSTEASFPYPYQVVLDATARVLPTCGFAVHTVDPARGMVMAASGLSLGSYGEDVTVQLGQASPTTPCQLRITSALSFGLVDWGRNRKNVDKILTALHAFLDYYAAGARLPG